MSYTYVVEDSHALAEVAWVVFDATFLIDLIVINLIDNLRDSFVSIGIGLVFEVGCGGINFLRLFFVEMALWFQKLRIVRIHRTDSFPQGCTRCRRSKDHQ